MYLYGTVAQPPFCFCFSIDLFFLPPDFLPWEPPTFIENIRKKVVDKFWPKEECSGHGQVTAGPPGTACQCDKFYTGNRRADIPQHISFPKHIRHFGLN
jgi:hypothetical protein